MGACDAIHAGQAAARGCRHECKKNETHEHGEIDRSGYVKGQMALECVMEEQN